MGKFLKTCAQALVATFIALLLLEGLCFLMGLPKGASRFVETVILRNHLSTHKPQGEIRIFTYGESTMHGAHYAPYSNPAIWLEAYLKDFLPGKKIKVVNFARMGQNSLPIYESFAHTLEYKPDIVVFYTGHNSFLPGNRYDQQLKKRNTAGSFFRELIRQSRLISAVVRFGISQRMERSKSDEDQMGYGKIETPPSGIGPENQVLRTSDYYKKNIEFFEKNVERMIKTGKQHHIPLIFFKPASNLKDFPPSCSAHMNKLSAGDEKNWNGLFEEGKKAEARGDLTEALSFYENAASVDDTYAELSYRIAQIYLNQGELQKAKQLFENARDNDCLIVRATRDKLAYFDQLNEDGRAIVLDTEKILSPEVPGGILGFPVVEDNVHFSPHGHARMARVLAQEFADRDWVAPKNQWQFDQERSYEEMAKTLGITPAVFFDSYLQCVGYFGHKFDQRIFFAKKALEIYADHPKALRHLAWAYWLKGDKKNAFKIYAELKKKYPDEYAAAMNGQADLKKAFEEFSVPALHAA